MVRNHILSQSGRGPSFKHAKVAPIKVDLISGEQVATSTAGVSLSLESQVTFNSSTFPELSDFAQVYDEARVLGVKLHYYPVVTTAGSSATASCAFAIGFDPSIGSFSAPQQVMEEAYSAGPFRLHAGINGGTIQSGNMLQSYHVLRARPPCPLAPITSSDVPGNGWFCLDGSTAPYVAVILGYVNSLGTSGVSTVYFFVELEVEFRLRT